ncbi:type IV secretory system conjugative DNA transfer family protein [Aneurinibacillus thermoaerophilus]|uniref:type IV secretory system conjugative DNA transfer family protein n=1 Tax=Aneurinibacillus thermoaerophilus TaxID=143495 RepID=UPI002E1B4960|nr:type IV secretory system conjugative DNA transfer family protein [Aneurinibacillus thermoaerophilus]MED0737840.1 type IV secretory system conjugative DNA transfer family protein [Aneurinibacillus thermoaerophilus]
MALALKEKILNMRHVLSSKKKEVPSIPSGPVISGLDAFLHTLVLGPTGCGKTSRILKPVARQVLEAIRQGKKVGLTVIEPKGDFAQDIADMCKEMGIPCVHIDPISPTSAKFNPLQGEAETVAEAARTVLKILFGKQDPFFAQVQQTAARNVILLLKELNGDNVDLMDVVRALRSQHTLATLVAQLKQLQGQTDLVQYFESEMLGSLKDKFHQFAMGLRQQLEDIAGNRYLKNIISGNSDIDLDKHLADGGVLVVNTEMGRLGTLGDTLGLFIMMHLQNAVFRRPGTEWTRTPHYLIVDEFSRYVNPDFERLLAIGRSFRCACFLALQSFGQLVLDGDPKFVDKVVTNTRNMICFSGLGYQDAKRFEYEFGEELRRKQSKSHKSFLFGASPFADSYKIENKWESRYNATQIMEFEAFHFLHRLTRNAQPLAPGYAKGFLIEDLYPKDGGGNQQESNKRQSAAKEQIRKQIKQVRRNEDGFIEIVVNEEFEKQMEAQAIFMDKWRKQADDMPIEENVAVSFPQRKITFGSPEQNVLEQEKKSPSLSLLPDLDEYEEQTKVLPLSSEAEQKDNRQADDFKSRVLNCIE